MSRIGSKPIELGKTRVQIGKEVQVDGVLGILRVTLPPLILVETRGNVLLVKPQTAEKRSLMMQGTARALLSNAVRGVSLGFRKCLVLVGIGYKAQLDKSTLLLQLGFSHPVRYKVRPEVTISIRDNGEVEVRGVDKQLVGQTASEIRRLRPIEPYKGKGIRYVDEPVCLKERKKNK